MISQKIVVEFCVNKGLFTSITLDLLPKNFLHRSSATAVSFCDRDSMADLLQKAIQAISLEEEEPLTLTDSPTLSFWWEWNKSTGTFSESRLPIYGKNDWLHANGMESVWKSQGHSVV